MTRFDRWAKNYTKWLKTARFDIRISIFASVIILALVFSTIFGFKGRHSDEPVELGLASQQSTPKNLVTIGRKTS
jgi:hypothetical protein